jgi:hypothetical protein
VCDPSDPRDTEQQNPTDHALAATTGAPVWQDSGNYYSFSPVTAAGHMFFNGLALDKSIVVRDTATGRLITQLALPAFNWSGIATVGNALVFGLGSTSDAAGAGIEVLTPDGSQPAVPRR